MTDTIFKDKDIRDMAVKIMKNSTWKKPTLTQELDRVRQLYNNTSISAAENRIKIIALEAEIKSLQSDKRWLQQLLQEMSSTQFMKAKNL